MRLGAYEVESEIGRGAVGAVFRARGPGGEPVALKLLLGAKADARARFAREARLLGSFGDADGFVPLLDQGDSPQGPFIVMPFLEGGTLRDRLAKGPLAPAEATRLGAAVARALGHAHAKGVVHRDVKPENVLFTRDGRPLLADLGLAKHFDPDVAGTSRSESLSATGVFRGTAGYMAPEQMSDAKSVGPPADVFALGAVLHECVTGEPAFVGATFLEVVASVTEGETRLLARARRGAPAGLAAAIGRALAKDPRERFADGFAFARALEAGVARSRAPWVVAALVAVVLGVVVVGAELLFAPLPTSPRSAGGGDAVRSPAAPRGEEARALFEEGDYKASVAAADRAIAADPKSALAYAARGCARVALRDPRVGLSDLERALALDPRCALAFAGRSTCHEVERDIPAAVADAERAIALAPTSGLGYAARGAARVDSGDAAGLADLDRAIELSPRFVAGWDPLESTCRHASLSIL